MTWSGWERQLLGALGIPATTSRRAFIRAWAACEGGQARYNPFNTTLELAGASLYNRAGVRNYADPLQGVAATLLTLRLSYYTELLDALRAPGLNAAQIARRSEKALSTWGTGSRCILSIVG